MANYHYTRKKQKIIITKGTKKIAETKIRKGEKEHNAKERATLQAYRKEAVPYLEQGAHNEYEKAVKELTKRKNIGETIRQLTTKRLIRQKTHYSNILGIPHAQQRNIYRTILNHLNIKDQQLRNDIIRYRNKILHYRMSITADLIGTNGTIATITLYGVPPEKANILTWWRGKNLTGSNQQLKNYNDNFKAQAQLAGAKGVTTKFQQEGEITGIDNIHIEFA